MKDATVKKEVNMPVSTVYTMMESMIWSML